jgi:hypothetical protein
MAQNLLQSPILVDFVYPFLLIFFIVFAVLEKTKLFGEGKQKTNSLVAFVIGLIFVGAIFPKMVVGNLILFLTVAIVIVFVVLILYSFATGGEGLKVSSKPLMWIIGLVIVIAVIIAMFLITGVWDTVIDKLFQSDWSSDLWTNIIFIVVIAAALAIVIGGAKSK